MSDQQIEQIAHNLQRRLEVLEALDREYNARWIFNQLRIRKILEATPDISLGKFVEFMNNIMVPWHYHAWYDSFGEEFDAVNRAWHCGRFAECKTLLIELFRLPHEMFNDAIPAIKTCIVEIAAGGPRAQIAQRVREADTMCTFQERIIPWAIAFFPPGEVTVTKSITDAQKDELVRHKEECAVCLEGYDDRKTAIVVPYGHFFHKSCFDESNRNKPEYFLGGTTCPSCRELFEFDALAGEPIIWGEPITME